MIDVLKAYAVQEEDEGTGGVVFAKSSAEARRLGAARFGDGDFNWGKARRLPWADGFAPGPVPAKAMIDHGWWYECAHCHRRIEDGAEDAESGEPVAFDVVETEAGHVYCAPKCHDAAVAESLERRRVEGETIADLTARLLAKLPGAVPTKGHHVYATRPNGEDAFKAQQGILYFTFPGAAHGDASLRFDKFEDAPQVMVPRGDLKAFEAWREAGYPAAMPEADSPDAAGRPDLL